jgi:hypothetical protein
MLGRMARRRKNPAAVALGRLGGRAAQAKMTPPERHAQARRAAHARWAEISPEERSALGRRAVLARWAKFRAKTKATRRKSPNKG